MDLRDSSASKNRCFTDHLDAEPIVNMQDFFMVEYAYDCSCIVLA